MTTDIKLALAKGKVEGAKVLLREELLRQDKQEFEAKLRAEYDELYLLPTVVEYNDDGIEVIVSEAYYHETAPIFEEYKNETRVVSEAVEATYDEDGMELTPAVDEVTELVRPYIAKEITEEELMQELKLLGYVPKEKTEALKYLADTDWYIVRYAETGIEVPQDILDARAKAREVV